MSPSFKEPPHKPQKHLTSEAASHIYQSFSPPLNPLFQNAFIFPTFSSLFLNNLQKFHPKFSFHQHFHQHFPHLELANNKKLAEVQQLFLRQQQFLMEQQDTYLNQLKRKAEAAKEGLSFSIDNLFSDVKKQHYELANGKMRSKSGCSTPDDIKDDAFKTSFCNLRKIPSNETRANNVGSLKLASSNVPAIKQEDVKRGGNAFQKDDFVYGFNNTFQHKKVKLEKDFKSAIEINAMN